MLRRIISTQRRTTYDVWRQAFFCSSSEKLTEGEQKIMDVLKQKFPGSKSIQVADISGGCGAMFEVSIEAEEFRGLKTVKQHMMVNKALKEEIEQMHGMRIHTKVPG